MAYQSENPGKLWPAVHSRPIRHRLPGVDLPHLTWVVLGSREWTYGRDDRSLWGPRRLIPAPTSRWRLILPTVSTFACSTRPAPSARCRSLSRTPGSGTVSSLGSERTNATDTESLGHTSRDPDYAATTTSCCSIHTPGQSPATWSEAPKCWATRSATPMGSATWTPRRSCPVAW